MAKAQDGSGPISEESIGYLEDVKKGKPRKFAMICKGTTVVSLVVYRKGNVEKRRKEAKESGKGQFYFGVVDGKGMDIRFVLARSDGFESPPVKTSILKGFLDESAELKCKPYFEIVDTAQFVLDEDDPLVARFLALQARALQACETHPDRAVEINTLCRSIGAQLDQERPDQATFNLESLEVLLRGLAHGQSPGVKPPSVDDGLAAKLLESLKGLKLPLEKSIAQHPNRKAELLAAFTQIRDQIKNQQLAEAQSSFAGLEKFLQTLLDTPATSPTEIKPESRDDGAQWKEKVAAWGPAIKAAITAKGPQAAEMMKLLAQANALSKPGGNLTEAIAKLTECHALIESTHSTSDPSAQFNERLRTMLPAVKAAIGTPAGDLAKLKVSEAGKFARDKSFEQANALLDEAQSALTSVTELEADARGDDEVTGDRESEFEEEAAQESQWRRKLALIEPLVLAAQKNRANEASWMTMLMSAQERADEWNFDKALELLARIEERLNTPPVTSPGWDAALKDWTQVRGQAIEVLKSLEAAISEMQDLEGNQAIILLKAIQANLSPAPNNLNAVNELEVYIRSDKILQDAESPNGFGIDVNIRTPLIAALSGLKRQITA